MLQKMPTGGKLVDIDFGSHLKARRAAGAKGDQASNYDGLNQKMLTYTSTSIHSWKKAGSQDPGSFDFFGKN